MSGVIRLRPFDDADHDDVVRLWQMVFPDDPGRNEPRAVIRRKREVQRELFLVATRGDTLVGTVVGGYDGHRGWIYHLAVEPELRRAGIGRRLMDEAEARLRALGCPKVNLQVRDTNTGVIEFYAALGYAVEARVNLGKPLEPAEPQLSGDVRIRDARPEDAPFLAWVMLAASRSHLDRGIWEFLNDQDEAAALHFLESLSHSEELHWCHHSLYLVAEVDGVPAAGLCGFDPTQNGTEPMQPAYAKALVAVGATPEQLAGIPERVKLMDRVNPDFAPGAWVVENVATRPEYRRRGLVAALLEAVLERGRERSFERAQISLLLGNDRARSAYLKQGFRPHDEKRDPEFEHALGTPGIERMLLTF